MCSVRRLALSSVLLLALILHLSVASAEDIDVHGLKESAAAGQFSTILTADIMQKGIERRSKPYLRRALADSVDFNGILVGRESAIDSLLSFAAECGPSARCLLHLHDSNDSAGFAIFTTDEFWLGSGASQQLTIQVEYVGPPSSNTVGAGFRKVTGITVSSGSLSDETDKS
ncbi:MAG: hypothetical protein Kow0074_17770 [Candidatus Zixiibacteriota bacterium]